MEYLRVTFRLEAEWEDVPTLVDSVLLEQTVETPREVAERDEFVREHMLGRVQDVRRLEDGSALATLDLPVATAGVDVVQLLNVLFGNASLHERVKLEDFDLPPSLLSAYPGPQFGIDGIRKRIRVFDRPLTCSAIKPVGLSVDRLADLCRTFARGGIDFVKDDHYLSEQTFSPFRERVAACQRAVEEESARVGRTIVYCPNLAGTPEVLLRQLEFAQELGVGAVMIAPMLVGLPSFYEIVRRHIEVPVLLHPSFAGSTRIRVDTLLGKLFRLLGGDGVIFANYGGRFSYLPEQCREIAQRLTDPFAGIERSFPVPAGGMTVERTRELVDFFGNDSMLLIGGSLLAAGEALLERTQSFTEAVAEAASGARRNDHEARRQTSSI